MKKYLLRLKLEDEMLIDTCEAKNTHLAYAMFLYRNSTMLSGYDGCYISQGISLISDGEDDEM